jgi:hypothetical protein
MSAEGACRSQLEALRELGGQRLRALRRGDWAGLAALETARQRALAALDAAGLAALAAADPQGFASLRRELAAQDRLAEGALRAALAAKAGRIAGLAERHRAEAGYRKVLREGR